MEKYEGLSPAKFFYRNREIAGFSNPARALYQTVRELIENSLDATETHEILPRISVSVEPLDSDPEKIRVRVEDNGIGVPLREVPNVFGKVFYGSKYVIRQTRGIFGLGVKMAVLYSQITTATPIYVKSSTTKSRVIYEYKLFIDIERNIPLITDLNVYKKKGDWHGTVVELVIRGNLSQVKKRIEEYVKRTALIAPYATISLIMPDGEQRYKRVSRKLPEPPKIGKLHPRGVDIEMLKSLIRKVNSKVTLLDLLSTYFDGVGRITAEKFCKWAGFDPDLKVRKLSLSDLEELANKMREYDSWRRPKPITLSPLGEKLLKEGVKNILKPEFVTAVTRSPSSYGGNPFIIEVAIAFGGKIPSSESPVLLRFANRIPLLYDEGADVSRKVVNSIDWSIYKIKFPAPLAVVTHICSTKVPFKGVGKEAIADVPEVERELKIAIREAGRRLKRYLTRIEKMYELKRREVTIKKYLNEVSRSLSYISGINEDKIKDVLAKMLEEDIKRRKRLRTEGDIGVEKKAVISR